MSTPMVVAEAVYLVDRQLGAAAEVALLLSIVEGGLRVADLTAADWTRIDDLVEQYADLRLGATDASVVAVAERLNATRIATLNRRHFAVLGSSPAAPTCHPFWAP